MNDRTFFFIITAAIVGYQILRNISRLSVSFIEWFSSQNWSETVGQVIASEVRVVSVPRYRKGGRVLPDRVMFTPDITYNYTVNGHTFQSSKIYLGQNSSLSDFDMADAIVKSYPGTRSLRVFFDPEKPELSCLERMIPRGFIRDMLFVIFWLLVELLIFYSIYQNW